MCCHYTLQSRWRLTLFATLTVPTILWMLSAPIQAQVESAPESRAPLPRALGDPQSVKIAPPVGAVSDMIPIVASPGRRHVEPRLSLIYNSMGGGGILGLGWSIQIGQVERWRGDGTPTVGDANDYSYALSGAGGHLREVGAGVYRATMEGVYREFRRVGDGWEMRDGEGQFHYFGSTASNRIDGEIWMLDRVQDRRGNTIRYSYTRHDGALYPTEIRYTGFAPTGDVGSNVIEFEYEDRPDIRISYQYGVRATYSRRLSRISIFTRGSLVRRYEFQYEQSALNGQSLLSRIDLVGTDDSSRITLRTLEYGSRSGGWNAEALTGTIPLDFADGDGRDTGVRVSDVNGDGFADVLGNGEGIYLGNGAGQFAWNASWSSALATMGFRFVDGNGADLGARLVDVNADARPDLFIANPSRCEVWLNNGTGWNLDPDYSASAQTLGERADVWTDSYYLGLSQDCDPPHCGGYLGDFPGCRPVHCDQDSVVGCDPVHCEEDSIIGCRPSHCQAHDEDYSFLWDREVFAFVDHGGDSKGAELVDVNADGRVDIVWSMVRTQRLWFGLGRMPVHLRAVFLNTGTGWEKNIDLTEALWSIGDFVRNSQLEGYDFLDVNCDGFADIVRTFEGGARAVYLGSGHSWTHDADWTSSLDANAFLSLTGDRVSRGLIPVDFNDDGLVDYMQVNESVKRGYRNTGVGWEESSQISTFLQDHDLAFVSDEVSNGVTLGDVDGDGIMDVLRSRAGSAKIFLSSALRDGLLTQATSALGEVTEINWAISSNLDNLRPDGIEGLPIILPVATSLTRQNGRMDSNTMTYHYSGGLFESSQFRGFASCEQTSTSGLRVVTHFHQEEGLAGQHKVQEGYDSDGLLRLWKSSAYEIVSVVPGIEQLRLVQIDQKTIDPGGFVHKRVTNAFDERLNYSSVTRDPNVEVSGDETLTQFAWAKNDTAGIWSLPSRVQVKGPTDEIVTESIILYDGLPEGEAERGLPCEMRDLVEPGTYVTKRMEYDQYGNVVRIQGRDGFITEFQYGDPTATYRTRAIDPEGRELWSEYDPRFGEIRRDVDASGNETTNEFDEFGRIVRTTLPGDESSPLGTRSLVYSSLGDPAEQFYRVIETQDPGEPVALETVYFFDALGFIYRVERDGPEDRKVITLTDYDEAGNVIETSRPFFEGEEPVMSVIERDDLRRPIHVLEPDGIGLTLNYAGLRADLLDRRGCASAFFRNGNSKVTEVHQWADGESQVTRYHYDIFDRLTTVVDAMGSETKIEYDALGRRTRLEDPNAGTYEYLYDLGDRLVEQRGPDGLTTRFEYNRAGDLIRKIFPDGAVTEFIYGLPGNGNGVGRIVRVRDAAGVVDMKYDSRGNVIERQRQVEGRTYVTRYLFDSLDRIRRITYPDGFVVDYEYDSGGNLGRVADGEGRTIANFANYNAAGQIGDMHFGNEVQSSFVYDELLRMTSIRTLTSEDDTIQSLDYTLDPGGNVLSIVDEAFGTSQTFEYDGIGRLVHAQGAYGDESYEYDAIGNLLRKGNLAFVVDPNHPQRVIRGIEYGSGQGNATGIDNNPHLESGAETLVLNGGRAPRVPVPERGVDSNPHMTRTFEIAYDMRGNVISKDNLRFEYDAENQLVRVRDKTGKVIEENIYDAGGERVIQRTLQGTTVFIDGIYEENRTHASRHVRAGGQLVATVMTPRATVRLIRGASGGPLGRSIGDLGGKTCLFILSAGLCLFAMIRISLKRGGWGRILAGLSSTAFAVRQRPWCTSLLWLLIMAMLNAMTPQYVLAALISRERPMSEKRFYYHSNHLGSTQAVTDDRAIVVERREYKPYGDPVNWTGPNSGPRELLMTYDGQRRDDATGLYYFGARHYDPEIGRFLTADTEVRDPLNPKTLHRYAFAAGNPIRYTDPTGHGLWDWVLGIFVAIVAIVFGVFLTIVTFGMAGPPLLVGLTFGLAFLGAGVFASVALARNMTPLDDGFWLSVAAGFILGAAVGAGLAALPAALGSVAASTAVGEFLLSLGANALFGAMVGAVEKTVAHLVSTQGSVETLLDGLVVSVATGAAIGALTGGLMKGAGSLIKSVGTAAAKQVAMLLARTGTVLFKGLIPVGRIAFAAWRGQSVVMLSVTSVLLVMGVSLASFYSSPRKNVGIPNWTFAGTWPGMAGAGGRSEEAAMLQLMPLAP